LRPASGHQLDAAKTTQQNDFLEAMVERVGPDPGGEQWKEEVPVAIREWLLLRGVLTTPMDADDAKYQGLLKEEPWARSFDGVCNKYQEKNLDKVERSGGDLTLADAQLHTIFELYGPAMAEACRAHRPCYAGLAHRFHRLVVRLAAAEPAADCYKHVHSTSTAQDREDTAISSLEGKDRGWKRLVDCAIAAAQAGERLGPSHCMTAVGATHIVPAEPRFLAPAGFRQRHAGQGGEMVVQSSPVVRFVSRGEDSVGLHTAVHTDPSNCIFPPMTLFTVTDVQVG
jgi:hypothetical protein